MLVSPVSVKSIFLKTEDLFRVLKMVSLWTPLIKIIIFFWTKCFDSEILKEFCAKRKELISIFYHPQDRYKPLFASYTI